MPGEAFLVPGTEAGEAPGRVRIALGSATDRETLRQSLERVAAASRRDRPGYAAVV